MTWMGFGSRCVPVLFFVAILATGVGCGDGGGEAGQKGEERAATASADPAIVGEFPFRMLLSGQDVGGAMLSVTAAGPSTGAVYVAVFTGEFSFANMKVSAREEALLGADLALVSSVSGDKETRGGNTVSKEIRLEKVDGRWYSRQIVDGEERQFTFSADQPNHWQMPSLLSLARILAGSESKEHEYSGVSWPRAGRDEPAAPSLGTVWFTLKDAREITLGGKTVRSREIRCAKVTGSAEDVTVFEVTPEGKLLSFRPESAPLLVVAEGYAAVEPQVLTDPSGTGSPRDAVVMYLKVRAGSVPAEDLNKVMDWKAIYDEMAAEDERAILLKDTFATLMIEQFRQQAGGIDENAVALITPLLKVTEDGDKATVTMPGKEQEPFLLRRAEDGWLITKFPR
jgi:hypothetical protein